MRASVSFRSNGRIVSAARSPSDFGRGGGPAMTKRSSRVHPRVRPRVSSCGDRHRRRGLAPARMTLSFRCGVCFRGRSRRDGSCRVAGRGSHLIVSVREKNGVGAARAGFVVPRDALEVVPTQVARDVLLGERKVSLTLLIPVEPRQVAHPAARRRARPLRKSLLLEREKRNLRRGRRSQADVVNAPLAI